MTLVLHLPAVPTFYPPIDSVITHPDEMESLEQYRVIDNYHRKDAHQVSLHAGQIVHVIEKHDTGWWMVMSDDEQGYAPAVYLEPVEENSSDKDVHPEDSIDEVYEAMESFAAENEDEVGFSAGERVHVVSKSMDGWWKIRSNGKVGYSPAALIRPKMSSVSNLTSSTRSFESEKFIYEEMNIHRPPPRRNTIDRTLLANIKPGSKRVHVPPGYDSPKSNPALAAHLEDDVYIDPSEEIYAVPPEDDEEEIYTIPPELSDEEDQANHYNVPRPMNGHTLSSTTQNGYHEGAGASRLTGPRRSIDTGKPAGEKVKISTSSLTTARSYSTDSNPNSANDVGKSKPSIYDDTVFENDDSKAVAANEESAPLANDDDDAVYENTEFDQEIIVKPSLLKKGPVPVSKSNYSPTQIRHKPKKHTPDDYEDLEHFEGKSPTELLPALDDYVDMDATEHNMYVASEELTRRGSDFSDTPALSPRTPLTPAPAVPGPRGVKSPPPLVSTASKPSLSKSMSMDVVGQPLMEDEYIEMESACANVEAKTDHTRPGAGHASPEQPIEHTRGKSKPVRPSPPPRNDRKKVPNKSQSSHNVLSKILKKKSPLIRARSMEDILSAASNIDYAEISREQSPAGDEETFKPTPPPLPPPRVPGAVKRQNSVESPGGPRGAIVPKPKPSFFKSAKSQKPIANGHLPNNPRRSMSPPSNESPASPSDLPLSPLRQSKGQDGGSEVQARREQLLSKMIERMQTRFIALHSYTAPNDGCLSFSAGAMCTVKQKKSDGWWLVRVGDKEGWTPGNYWKEDTKANGPPKASEVIRKPRSHTVATDTVASSLEPTSSTESALPTIEDPLRSSSVSVNSEERSQLSSSMDSSRPLLPTRPPPMTKPKGKVPPPPRPRPYGTPQQGLNTKKPKPVPPQKPTAAVLARISPVPSPPPERRKKKSVSPPPLPPPNQTRKFRSPYETSSFETKGNDDEYIMLQDATISVTDIKSAPWFSGKMDRMQAEQFLMEYGRQREFLVRERTAKDGFYALSIRYHYSCKHFNIDPTSDGQYSMGTLTFPNIDEIIRHYQQNSLFIHDGQHVTLGQPAKKKTRGSDASKYNNPVHC